MRLVWDEGGGFIVLEALEPEFQGSWCDMTLTFIDPRRANERDRTALVATLRAELVEYLGQVLPG